MRANTSIAVASAETGEDYTVVEGIMASSIDEPELQKELEGSGKDRA
jgi:hypothetical protein